MAKKPDRKRSGRRRKRSGDAAGVIAGDGDGAVSMEVSGDMPELGAADRKLIWKGDAVALPARSVDFGGVGESRSLGPQEINQAIKSQSSAVLSCITVARGNAPLDAQITVKMLVDGGGAVTAVRMRAPAYLFEHGFYTCARKAATAMRFPATGAPTVVEAPYDLY